MKRRAIITAGGDSGRLFSVEARLSHVEPDLAAMPEAAALLRGSTDGTGV